MSRDPTGKEGLLEGLIRMEVPKELLWDYKEPPEDLMWRLQRIADFFPAHGTNRVTVQLLYDYRDRLKLEEGKYRLIGIYKEAWDERAAQRTLPAG